MKDLHIEQMNLEAAWPEFIAKLLETTKFGTAILQPRAEVSEYDEGILLPAPDLVVSPTDGSPACALEVKVFRSRREWANRASDATRFLESVMQTENLTRGIVVVTLDGLSSGILNKDHLDTPEGIEVWGIDELRRLAEPFPELLDDLESLVAETGLDETFRPQVSLYRSEAQLLHRRLSKTRPGRDDWSRFEQLCGEAIREVFKLDIAGWRSQNRTSDGLNRMDFIGRIGPNAGAFWKEVERDFRARYVVFEAKNYTDPISQGEIYTTEKYLFTNALRPVAIIVARNGADESAHKAISGALREQGKLILIVTLQELLGLLKSTGQGDEPGNILLEKMDDLLTGLGR